MLDNTNSENIVLIAEISKNHNNKELIEMAKKLFCYLIENNLVNNDVLVIISYIKHFSKTIKTLTFSKNNEIINNVHSLSLNNIILEFIKGNQTKNKLANLLVYYKDSKDISINKINSKFPLNEFSKYYQ